MSSTFHISRLTRAELHGPTYGAFLKEIFALDDVGQHLAWLDWLFLGNPEVPQTEDLTIYTCWMDTEIVGQLGVLPCPTSLRGEHLLNGWCVDFHVLKRAQRQGLGEKLLRAAFADFPMLSTLGQSDLSRNLFIKLGWLHVGSMTCRKTLLNPHRSLPKTLLLRAGLLPRQRRPYQTLPGWAGSAVGPVTVTALADFTGHEDLLRSRNRESAHCFAERSVEFMNWRYADCPQKPYAKLLLTHDGEKAIAVLRLYSMDGWYRGSLVDLLCDGTLRGDKMKLFMRAVEHFAAKSGIEVFEIETSDSRVLDALARGPLQVRTQTYRFLYGSLDGLPPKTSMEEWLLFAGDCDSDIVNWRASVDNERA